MAHSCFKQGCMLEVQYVCLCLCFKTYSCEFHLQTHLKLPNRIHNFDSILVEPSEGAKCAILEFLLKEKSKNEKLKKIALADNRQDWSNNKLSIKKSLRRLASDLKEINSLIEKISEFPEKEEDSSITLCDLQQDLDIKRDEKIISKGLEPYKSVSLFCKLGQLRNKKPEILNKVNNKREIDEDFRRTCLLYENHSSDSLFNQDYREYISAYQKITSTYLIRRDKTKINLYIYDTESEREEVKEFKISKAENWIDKHIMVKLPNGELFILLRHSVWYDAYIIDINYQWRNVPFVNFLNFSTAIYFNGSVYCFSSGRFDLSEYKWSNLTENRLDDNCESVVFKDNILISSELTCKLSLYSIDIDSFSEIPYIFSKNKKKILINGGEILYVIESWKGWIYESEIGNEYAWNKIGKSMIDLIPNKVCLSYNKGGFYISCLYWEENIREYFKFDLAQKSLSSIACYGNLLAFKRSELEAIECYGQDLRHSPNAASAYLNKRFPLSRLVKYLEKIELCNENIELDDDDDNYLEKGISLRELGRYLEALECFNECIKLNPARKIDMLNDEVSPLLNKAFIFYDLDRYLEALECYDELIKLKPTYLNSYMGEADSLYALGRFHEAIECYNFLITVKPDDEYAYIRKADTLHSMGKNLKAVKWFNKAIKLNSNNPLYYCYMANMLNDLGEITEAIQDFNKAYNLLSMNLNDYIPNRLLVEDYLELLQMLNNLMESASEFKDKVEKNFESEEKEVEIKENYEIIKKAVKCIDWKRTRSIEKIGKIKLEIIEYQKAKIGTI